MHARLRGASTLLILHQIINNSLADEITEPHADMNIKVAAFTVSEKSSNRPFVSRPMLYALTMQVHLYICRSLTLFRMHYTDNT